MDFAPALRKHVDCLLLFAYFRTAMLRHPSRDLAVAAVLTAARLHAGPAAAAAAEARLPAAFSLTDARACAAALWGQLRSFGSSAAAAALPGCEASAGA